MILRIANKIYLDIPTPKIQMSLAPNFVTIYRDILKNQQSRNYHVACFKAFPRSGNLFFAKLPSNEMRPILGFNLGFLAHVA